MSAEDNKSGSGGVLAFVGGMLVGLVMGTVGSIFAPKVTSMGCMVQRGVKVYMIMQPWVRSRPAAGEATYAVASPAVVCSIQHITTQSTLAYTVTSEVQLVQRPTR